MSPAFLNLKNLNKRHQMKTTLCCLFLKVFFVGVFCFLWVFSFSFFFFSFLLRTGFLGKKSPCIKNSPFKKNSKF